MCYVCVIGAVPESQEWHLFERRYNMSQHTIINEALWCYREALVYQWHSPDVRKPSFLVQT